MMEAMMGIAAGVLISGGICEMLRRALLGARLQRSMARSASVEVVRVGGGHGTAA